jgi:hypothetical protein
MSGHSMEQPGALPFDSTQTIRAVTVRELRDPNQQKWFAVQLAVSDRPVNLETIPRFDVFEAHRLYAIQGRLGARTCYALRLGFFTEQQAALTICTDLQAFYRAASVVQVSEAEQVRFEGVRTQAPPAQKPSSKGADVVEMSSARRGVATSPAVAARATTSPPKPAAEQPKRGGAGQGRKKYKSLAQELLEEARQIERAKSTSHNTKQRATSWLSRWLGR